MQVHAQAFYTTIVNVSFVIIKIVKHLYIGLRILHRTTILSARPHDPAPELKLPHTMPTDDRCPFEREGGELGNNNATIEKYNNSITDV
jgi:hypothetical protein